MRRRLLPLAAGAMALAVTGCSLVLDWSPVDGEGDDCSSPSSFYADVDEDGFGDPEATPVQACEAPIGYVDVAGDCADNDGARHPGVVERCNMLDDDCDGEGDPMACSVGCADGGREAFTEAVGGVLRIAACSGGFDVPGLAGEPEPACGRGAGDDGANPLGQGCRALDLCADGWHVCATVAEVAASAPEGCGASLAGSELSLFFATQQSGAGGSACNAGTNDLFGCGNLGAAPAADGGCAPLDRTSGELCASLGAPWSCGVDGTAELLNTSKTGPAGGGVLCCRL